MILYDKKSNFLGMGQSELSMLGYEDMEEFKSNFSDFADLFVEHPGYISKFKNFSWIDYTLHSGAPNKSVILKHKSGTEIETQLTISEISLIDKINDENILYCIKLNATMSSEEFSAKPDIKLSSFKEEDILAQVTEANKTPESIKGIQDILEDEKEQEKNIYNYDTVLSDDYEEKIKKELDYTQANKLEDDINIDDDFKIEQKYPYENDFKIEEDYKPAEESVNYKNDDQEDDQPIKLKVVLDDDKNPNKAKSTDEQILEADESIALKKEPLIEDEVKYEEIHKDIDFTQIAEDTGMDLGDIAEFITEFVTESKNYMEELNNPDNMSNSIFIKNETIKLKGIASNFKMANIINTLNSILENAEFGELSSQLQILGKQIKNIEDQLS